MFECWFIIIFIVFFCLISPLLEEISFIFIPYFKLLETEKIILKQIKEYKSSVNDISKYNIEDIKKFYYQSLESKKTIENKAKFGSIGVTVAIGLVYGLVRNHNELSIWSIILACFGLLHALMAGYLALKMLSDKNQIYTITLDTTILPIGLQKKDYYDAYELNKKMNIIRTNYIDASYSHLVWSILIIIIAFSLSFLKEIYVSK